MEIYAVTMVFLCKFCETAQVEWPENYQKGMSPIEIETHISHDKKRCQDIKSVNFQNSRDKGPDVTTNLLLCGVDVCTQCIGAYGFDAINRLSKLGRMMRV